MKSRIITFLMAIILIVSILPVASAQDTCFNLAAADCEALDSAMLNTTANLSSFFQEFSIDFSLTGLEALDMGGDITLNVTGSGPFAIDFASGGEFPIAMEMTMNASFDDGSDGGDSGSVSFVVLGDNFYLQDPDSGAWEFAPINTVLEDLGSELGVSPEDLMSGNIDPADFGLDLSGLDAIDPAAMEGLANVTAIPGFINFERLGDESMMGQNMSPYSLTFDLTALFASAEFQSVLNETLGAFSSDPTIGSVAPMIPMLMEGMAGQVNVSQFVGADDNMIHRLTFSTDFSMDMGALFGAPDMEPIAMDLDFAVNISEYGSTFNIVAPEGAIEADM